MKKIITALLILATAITSVLALTGCEKKEETITHTAFVLGIHENFPIPSPTALYSEIYESVYSGGSISAVVSDGSADKLSYETAFEMSSADMEDTKKQKAESNTNTVIYELLKLKPDSPESDLLQAVTTAANQLNSYENGKKVIYICDSGVSTSGLLDFTDPTLLETSPDEIIGKLEQLSALPMLQGITVKWTGFGQVCGAQSPLPSSYVNKLKELWSNVFYECGALIDFDSAPISDGINSFDMPECSTVEVSADRIFDRTNEEVHQQDTPADVQ